MANVGYVNKEVAKMYGIPYSELTPEQKKILHEDSVRRAKLIKEREEAVLKNNLKAFEDEAKMEKVLASIYASCQKEILASVTETISKVKKAGGDWSYANQSALTRSRGLFEQIGEQIKALGQKEQITFRQGLSNIYTDQFLRQVYDLGQSIMVKANFNRLNPALIQKTLDYPWSGAMFSDRLWQDKERLGRNLRVGLTQSMILGEGIPQITDRINRGIDTARYNAERVARTETKRVTYCAHDDVYKDTGVEELRYRCANGGDSRTCQYCRADNGKVFKRGEEPTLPRHPNCRCVYIPVVSDTFEDNELNDLTQSVRGEENFDKWLQKEAEKERQAYDTNKSTPKAEETPKKVSNEVDKGYNEELSKLDDAYKAKSLEISTMQDEHDKLDTQYRGYAVVRRGLQEPEEAGFKSRADFEAVDKELDKQIRKLKEDITEAQAQLKDITRDRQYLLTVGSEKMSSLSDYQSIREALRKNRTFDYVQYGDELMEAIAKMDVKEVALQRQFYKNGSKASWKTLTPSKVFKDGAISDVRLFAQEEKIPYNEVKKLKKALTEDEIIEKIAGGDLTEGSCASVGLAYIANKAGFDVTDFRGGVSRQFFAWRDKKTLLLDLPNVVGKTVIVKKECADTAKYLKTLDFGKEYYLCVGGHASIVKNTQDGVMYLELQSGRDGGNGWKYMEDGNYTTVASTLNYRFGARKGVRKMLGRSVDSSFLILDVDSFRDNPEFIKLMGYINTATGDQKKGARGSVK